MSSSRRTYDTDSIVLRRIFAYDISNSPFSTGYVLTSLTKGVATFTSPNFILSTIGVNDLPAQLSSLQGEIQSTISTFYINLPSSQQIFLPSTVTGLGSAGYISTSQLVSTVEGLGSSDYVSTNYITSTIIGLGTFGYLSSSVFGDIVLSTVEGLGSAGYISSSQLTSTVQGLGSIGYISTLDLISASKGLDLNISTAFTSTVGGLGNSGYISTQQLLSSLDSTITVLGSLGYISTASFYSTINNLGRYGFVSSLASTVRSSFSNSLVGNWCNAGFLYNNLGPYSTIQTFQFDFGNAMRNQIVPSTTNLDIEFKANSQFGYYDSRSIRYDFSTCLVKGTAFSVSSIIGQENYSYYILNASAVNLPFFFHDKYRFLINDLSTISTLKTDITCSTLSLFHVIGVSSPATNQFFSFPARPTSITVVLDNTTRTRP